MVKWIKKIGQGCFLLVILLALIGVNIKQLYCCHAQNLHWELCLLPNQAQESFQEECCGEGCCKEDCCGAESCHHTTRYDFLKITDYTQIETESEISFFPLELSVEWRSELLKEESVELECEFLEDYWPDRVFLRPLLCTYLC